MTPNALNNKAVELLEGDRASVAEEVLEQTLMVRPHHPEATYNRGLIRWRSGRITDEELITQLEEARPSNSQRGMIDYLLGLVHVERGDKTMALEALRTATLEGEDRPRQLASRSLSTVESDQGTWGRCVSQEYLPESDVLAVSSDGRWMVSANPYPRVSDMAALPPFEDHPNKGFPYLVLWNLEKGTRVRQFDGSKEVRGQLDVERIDSGGWVSHSNVAVDTSAERLFLGRADKACFDSNGRQLLSGHADGLLRLWNVATGRCIRIFRQQQPGGVSCLAFSPDGRWAVSGGNGSTACGTWEYADPWVWLWEVESGQCVRTFEGHEGHVSCVAISPDGQRVFSGNGRGLIYHDGTARLWDVSTGACLRTIEHEKPYTAAVGFNPDGSLLFTADHNGTLHFWSAESGERLQTLSAEIGNCHCIDAARFSPDGRHVLSSAVDGTARLWEMPSRRCLWTIRFERYKRLDVSFAGDGSTAFLYGGLQLHRLELPDSRRSPWALAPIRSRDVETAEDKQFSLILSEARKALELGDISSALHSLRAARKLPDRDRTPDVLDLWNQVGRGARRVALRDAWMYGSPVRLDSDDHRAVAVLFKDGDWHALVRRATVDDTLQLWAGSTGSRTLTMVTPGEDIVDASFSSDGAYAVSAHDSDQVVKSEGRLRIWNLRTGECVTTVEFSKEEEWIPTSCAIFGEERRCIIAGVNDHTTRIFDTHRGRCLRTLADPWRLGDTAWNRIKCWCRSLMDREYLEDAVWGWTMHLCLSPDERMALSVVSSEGREGISTEVVRLWELATGRCIRSFSVSGEAVSAACFSPDGRWILTGQTSKARIPHRKYHEQDLEHKFNRLRLWDVATGRCIRSFSGCVKDEVPHSVCFSPDGLWAVSSHGRDVYEKAETFTVRIWSVISGECIKILRGHSDAVTGVWISPNARWLLTASDGTLRQWELDWELEAPRHVDWDDGALPFLQHFLTLHTPYESTLPTDSEPSEQQVRRALTRSGSPSWNEQGFQELILTLGHAGYGWIRPEGVRSKLEQIATDWTGPPPLMSAKATP